MSEPTGPNDEQVEQGLKKLVHETVLEKARAKVVDRAELVNFIKKLFRELAWEGNAGELARLPLKPQEKQPIVEVGLEIHQQLQKLAAENQALREQLAGLERQLQAAAAERDHLRDETQALQKRAVELAAERDAQQRRRAELEASDRQARLAALQEQCAALEVQLRQRDELVSQSEARAGDLEAKIAGLEKVLAARDQTRLIRQLQKVIEELQVELRHTKLGLDYFRLVEAMDEATHQRLLAALAEASTAATMKLADGDAGELLARELENLPRRLSACRARFATFTTEMLQDRGSLGIVVDAILAGQEAQMLCERAQLLTAALKLISGQE